MLPVLEAVPNFSEGRDLDLVRELVGVIAAEGAEVLDWSADPDHHRSVVTCVGDPETVERAAISAARFARDHIDLRRHSGVHPRVGALDVLPLTPLHGLTMNDAVESARRVGAAVAELGVPVYWYGAASPTGRALSELRRGGVEALRDGFPPGREPDLAPSSGGGAPHPSAGVTCVGARPLLLAWNVYVEGLELGELRTLAASARERGGGFASLRALALDLERRGSLQISMNLEDPEGTPPMDVFSHIETRVEARGGRITGTEVVGMLPDALVLPAAADRLRLFDPRPSRLLSARLADHLSRRASEAVGGLLDAIAGEGDAVPETVRQAAVRAAAARGTSSTPSHQR